MRFATALALLVLVAPGLPGEEGSFQPGRHAFAVTDEVGFRRKGPPGPNDWLDRFPEDGRQTYEAYVASGPVRAGSDDVIAFLPFGSFDRAEGRLVRETVRFACDWFALDAEVLRPHALPEGGPHRIRWGRPQYLTSWFLRGPLPRARPRNAVCVFGVTMADLYPRHDWEFVFGQATLRGQVGVWSFARLFDELESEEGRRRALRRACKLVVHEAGHAFGLEHCARFECVMNGSNSLREMERQPLHLCPPCLRKLHWNRRLSVDRRYELLLAFYARHGLGEEARWTRARLARIRGER